MATEVVAAQRRIIRRPRLTSMLDESSARIRLLIAPAGYGKTTLAREWLGEAERNDVWYRGGPASADVAALAAGISESVGTIVPDAGKRMRERLRATGHPEEDVEILAELFAEDVQTWPADAWLAIDDYQFAMESVASERFVDLLTQGTPIQMLITSRRRPTWATARRILYGEIQEIDRRSLAMEPSEEQEVVGRDDPELARFLQRARGWPAVIGLVGLSTGKHELAEAVPEKLYDYFAQELYESLSKEHRKSLGMLSFASGFDRRFAEHVLGETAGKAIESGVRTGALSPSDRHSFDLHPLFAEFLRERVFETFVEKQDAAARIGRALLTAHRWDEAVDIACRFELPDLLVGTMEDALDSLLDSGRLPTVTRWLDAGAALQSDSPVLDLAEAEVAFRVGDYRRAEGVAEQAARRLGRKSRFCSRAYMRAGHSALLASREEISISYFEHARATASDGRDLREALFGLYSAMSELELPRAAARLAELDGLDLQSADDQVRASAAKLTNAVREGDVENGLDLALSGLTALDRATNPLIITSFLHAFSNAWSSAGRYQQGLRLANELLTRAKEHRLGFVRPFGVIDRAIGHLGLRSFADANHDIELLETLAPDDVHIQGNLAALRCRLLLATGRASLAAEAAELGFFEERPPAPLEAEILACRALALACARRSRRAVGILKQAEGLSENALVVQVLGPIVRGICSKSRVEREEYFRAAWSAAINTGNLDTLVCAYRAHPDLLVRVAEVADLDRLAGVLIRANDTELAKKYGISIHHRRAPESAHLTPRETEVMDLVATGLSNREVAKALYVAESTVKVHLRHAYEKLGVRGRSEAIPKWLTRR
ncbi:MAG: LuxR C-terminal-related transcriptional regulator [Gaiellales bacterium]